MKNIMQAVFIAYDLAHHENILEVLNSNSCRGYTNFGEVQGKGSKTGEPHLGTHAWPSMASAIITFVDDEKLEKVLNDLHALDLQKPRLGLRAFAWPVTATV